MSLKSFNPAEKGPRGIEERRARDGHRHHPSIFPREVPLDSLSTAHVL